jgi:predicted metal-binding transcription factor (methanogenesis marker protein 9)
MPQSQVILVRSVPWVREGVIIVGVSTRPTVFGPYSSLTKISHPCPCSEIVLVKMNLKVERV